MLLDLIFVEKEKDMRQLVSTQLTDQGTRLFVSLPQSFSALLAENAIPFQVVGDRVEFEYTSDADRLGRALWNDITELRAAWLSVCQTRQFVAGGQLTLSLPC